MANDVIEVFNCKTNVNFVGIKDSHVIVDDVVALFEDCFIAVSVVVHDDFMGVFGCRSKCRDCDKALDVGVLNGLCCVEDFDDFFDMMCFELVHDITSKCIKLVIGVAVHFGNVVAKSDVIAVFVDFDKFCCSDGVVEATLVSIVDGIGIDSCVGISEGENEQAKSDDDKLGEPRFSAIDEIEHTVEISEHDDDGDDDDDSV